MNEKPSCSDNNKTGTATHAPGNVGQYVPQVFMFPYYAPPPGFPGYSQGPQQHPQMPQQMFGQMPQGVHPTPMPVSGMQPVPMGPMAPMPMPPMASSSMPNSSAAGVPVLASEQCTTKVGVSDDKAAMLNVQQPQIPRACWTPIEEEILVKSYAEYTIGKKLKKINRKTWEAITHKLYQEGKKQIPQVSIKSWMQCKDKWNNMIKKHKLQKAEYLRGPGEGNAARDKTALFEAMDKVLSYEFMAFTEQENQFIGDDDAATMVPKSNESDKSKQVTDSGRLPSESVHIGTTGSYEKTAGGDWKSTGNEGKCTGDEGKCAGNDGKHAENREEAAYEHAHAPINTSYSIDVGDDDDDGDDDGDRRGHGPMIYMHPTMHAKRQGANDDDNGIGKRVKMDDTSDEGSVNEKLCKILMHQTELLERAHAQHCELMQQVRMSEENTRMMVVQAIKDLGTILNKLIKSEQF